MANTQKYLNHLLQNTGITPACSEEEREAADVIAAIFRKHGFEPEIQEFSASNTPKMVQAVMGIVLFVGTFLATFGGIPGVVGLLLVLAVAIIYTIERLGKPVVSQLGAGGLSQNVIAYHKASGPLASPRNRPVVVVAHYDSPRADFMAQEPFARYRPLLFKALPPCMVASAILLVVRLLPFPSGVKNVLWFVALLISLVPLVNAVAIIANRFVLPYTSGSVCNKSSVAAMLGVMNEVAPYEGGVEFPDDIPFDEYFSEQVRMAQEAAAAAEAERLAREAARAAKRGGAVSEELEGEPEAEVAEDEEPAGETAAFGAAREAAATAVTAPVEPEVPEVPEARLEEVEVEDEKDDGAPLTESADDAVPALEPESEPEPEPEPEPLVYPRVNDEGNLRFGEDIVRSLGMLSASCAIVYEEPVRPAPAPMAPAPAREEESREEPREAVWGGSQDVLPDEELDDLPQGAADDDVDWETMPEPIPLVDFYDEGEFEAGESAPGVFEIIRDWVSRFISFVRSKIEQIRAGSESEPLEAEDEDAEASEEDAEQDASTEAADESPIEDEAAEEGADGDVAAESDAAALDSGEEEGPSEAEQTIVGEAEVEKTVERTAVVADRSPVGAERVPAAEAEVTRQNEPAEKKTDTLDALMAEISAASAPAPARQAPQRVLNIPSVDAAPVAPSSTPSPSGAGRSALFDLPDPAAAPIDPFASNDVSAQVSGSSAGVGGRRDAGDSESMSDWLGLGSDFDAKQSGREIGSWANFDDDSSWKGGAASASGASEAELREAITSMGDDELLGHDIWFVAAGASESGNAGIETFLKEHRSMLRGVFIINLECVGAGQVAMIATEGRERVLKGDRRIMNLVSRVSEDFHHEFGSVELPFLSTDAYAAMNMSLRSLTIGGVDGTGFALSHSEEDQPYNVNPDNITIVADVVTEVIRRS